MDFTALIGAAIARLDLGMIGAIYAFTQVLKILDPKDRFSKLYAFIPLVLGIVGGFLITQDWKTAWKTALITGFVHGALSAWLYTFVKDVFKVRLPGDKGTGQ